MIDPKRNIGPNLKKLAMHRMSIDAVPPGGGLQAAVDFIMSPNGMKDSWAASLEWAIAAVSAVRAAPDNPFGTDEEAIAGELLKRIDERKAAQALAFSKVK